MPLCGHKTETVRLDRLNGADRRDWMPSAHRDVQTRKWRFLRIAAAATDRLCVCESKQISSIVRWVDGESEETPNEAPPFNGVHYRQFRTAQNRKNKNETFGKGEQDYNTVHNYALHTMQAPVWPDRIATMSAD